MRTKARRYVPYKWVRCPHLVLGKFRCGEDGDFEHSVHLAKARESREYTVAVAKWLRRDS